MVELQRDQEHLAFINMLLRDLKGLDLMALEILQNAADAGAERFHIVMDDEKISFWNDGLLTFCVEPYETIVAECKNRFKDGTYRANLPRCNVHALNAPASETKKLENKNDPESKNIGRFGIGISSIFQCSDYPTIKSGHVRFKFLIEKSVNDVDNDRPYFAGTLLEVPWAKDPSSNIRRALGNAETVTPALLAKAKIDIPKKIIDSLTFIHSLKFVKFEIKNERSFEIQIEDAGSIRKITKLENGKTTEYSYLLLTDLNNTNLQNLAMKSTKIKNENRQLLVQIALPLKIQSSGFFYAFLPTKQKTGLPFHINGDFYPNNNRTEIELENFESEVSNWNRQIVSSVGDLLRDHVAEIINFYGVVNFWKFAELIWNSWMSIDDSEPAITIWPSFAKSLKLEKLVLTTNNKYVCVGDLILISEPHSSEKRTLFTATDVSIANESLETYRELFADLGSRILDLDTLLEIISHVPPNKIDLELAYLLRICINDFSVQDLQGLKPPHQTILHKLKFMLTTDNHLSNIETGYLAQENLDRSEISKYTINLIFFDPTIIMLKNLASILKPFSYEAFTKNLMWPESDSEEQKKQYLNSVRHLIVKFDDFGILNDRDFEKIRNIKMWLSSDSKWISCSEGFYPDGFNDPLGLSQIFLTEELTDEETNFLKKKLRCGLLNAKEYVQRNLNAAFSSKNGTVNKEKYHSLLSELVKFPNLATSPETRSVLQNLFFVPTVSGKFVKASEAIWKNEKYSKIVGENFQNWINEDFVDSENLAIENFLSNIGARSDLTVPELVQFWVERAHDRGQSSVGAIHRIIDFLALEYFASPDKYVDELSPLLNIESLPVSANGELWSKPEDLLLKENIRFVNLMSVKVIEGLDENDLVTRFLHKDLGVPKDPNLKDIMSNLAKLSDREIEPERDLYSYLNRRAAEFSSEDETYMRTFYNKNIIFDFEKKRYLTPEQLFYTRDGLVSGWCYEIPRLNYERDKLFYDAVGVKERPEPNYLMKILNELIRNFDETSIENQSASIATMRKVWKSLDGYFDRNQVSDSQILTIAGEHIFLNRKRVFNKCSNTIYTEKEWLVDFFGSQLDDVLLTKELSSNRIFKKLGMVELSDCLKVDNNHDLSTAKVELIETAKVVERKELCYGIIRSFAKLETKLDFLDNLQVFSCSNLKLTWTLILEDSSSTKLVSENQTVHYDSQEHKLFYINAHNLNWLDCWSVLLPQLDFANKLNEKEVITLKFYLRDAMEKEGELLEKFQIDLVKNGLLHVFSEIDEIDKIVPSEVIYTDDHGTEIPEPTSVPFQVQPEDVEVSIFTGVSDEQPIEESSRCVGMPEIITDGAIGSGPSGSTPGSNPRPPLSQPIRTIKTKNPAKDPFRSTSPQKPVVYVYGDIHAERADRDADPLQVAKADRKQKSGRRAENLVYEILKGKEYEVNRASDPNNKGYDLSFTNEYGALVYVEVKSTISDWEVTDVGLTVPQFEKQLEFQKNSELWVVEKSDGEEPVVWRFENFVSLINRVRISGQWKRLGFAKQEMYTDKMLYQATPDEN